MDEVVKIHAKTPCEWIARKNKEIHLYVASCYPSCNVYVITGTIVDKILKIRHIFYSYFFPYQATYKMLEKVIKIFIWGKHFGYQFMQACAWWAINVPPFNRRRPISIFSSMQITKQTCYHIYICSWATMMQHNKLISLFFRAIHSHGVLAWIITTLAISEPCSTMFPFQDWDSLVHWDDFNGDLVH